jgi:hypothetical protein
VVFIQNATGPEAETTAPPPEKQATDTKADDRVASLEARIEVLEAILRDALAAARRTPAGTAQRKLVWLTSTPGESPNYSPEQERALTSNLGGVRAQGITIRTPVGDLIAQAHAEWFKLIFERAGWTVHGPEEISSGASVAGLCLAVPDLPVAKDAAATYLALKAAGFETDAVLDSTLPREPGEGVATISLTLPPGRAA